MELLLVFLESKPFFKESGGWPERTTAPNSMLVFNAQLFIFQPIAPFNSITTQILEPCNIHLQFLQSVMCFLSFFFFVRFSRGMLNFYSICLLILYLIWDF
ncbi:hypothetical protein POPTR_017G044550v4 [Populus trichocarpa]|uniref:Uncharacterized protein n=1 Tax=Populus trichocarpa TaxID=3694 RepID=A0ACC0RPB7_POPTR|nr:hypothetical protein POPTR_017G044550v4 [Populus trichocarpa]